MRTSVKYVLLFFALVAMIGIGITLFSGDSEARLCVWDGGDAGALASTAANWDTDTAPVAGDDILFDGLNATGDDPCTWDISLELGTFTIGSGYSGTITQSSDMHITGYSQAGGVFTGSISKWVYCSGNFLTTSGAITDQRINLNMYGINKNLSSHISGLGFNKLYFKNNTNILNNVVIINELIVYNGVNVNITLNKVLEIRYYSGVVYNNSGSINGLGSLKMILYNLDKAANFGYVNVPLELVLHSSSVQSRTLKILDDSYLQSITVSSSSSSYTITLNLNGHSLTATTITVGTRGILDCGNGTITCSALTSTSGTIIEDTATWIFNDGAVVTATSGEKFYNVHMKGDCDFVNALNVTNELRWIDVPTEYGALDVYLDSIYSQTIPSYTFGPEQTAAAEYSYLPDVQISMSQFYEDIDFSIYAYISTNLPVTYNITGTASGWLSYHEGRIVGMPPDIGNYTYTITATHASGSVDVINGYILVGSLSTAEYSYDQIWGLILWIVITAFMLIGLLLNIPLIQIVAFMGTIGSIVASLRIPEFEVFLMMFALGNSALFFIGMVRYRR